MLIGDLIYNDDFDTNCNFAVYDGQWNGEGVCVWSTAKNGYSKPPCSLLDKPIKYITIDTKNNVLVLEY